MSQCFNVCLHNHSCSRGRSQAFQYDTECSCISYFSMTLFNLGISVLVSLMPMKPYEAVKKFNSASHRLPSISSKHRAETSAEALKRLQTCKESKGWPNKTAAQKYLLAFFVTYPLNRYTLMKRVLLFFAKASTSEMLASLTPRQWPRHDHELAVAFRTNLSWEWNTCSQKKGS